MEENKVPYITVIIPAYNEEAIIEKSVSVISDYLKSKEDKFTSEILIINDGSTDRTGILLDSMVKSNKRLRVIHHHVNMNLGRALQTGFKNAHGDLIVVMDVDLSYSVDHIEKMIHKQIETDADIIIASPYMKNGKVSGVPFMRAVLSKTVNRFMRFASQEKYNTYTGMVRTYKAGFIKNLNLKTKDYEINPEIIYKAMVLRARIVEIPAYLDWSFQNEIGGKRKSGMKIIQSFFSGLMAGFIFRPYIFYFTFGIVLFLIAAYIIGWIFINTFQVMPTLQVAPEFIDDRFSQAIALVFQKRAHAFFVGGITLILAVQILSLGFISLQNKRYFEEIFHLGTSIYKNTTSTEKN